MNLENMIYKRKSSRKFESTPVNIDSLAKISEFCNNLKPLSPEINVRFDILEKENVKCIFPWIAPQTIAVYSEQKQGYLENVGFMFQQLDLYLQELGLGCCWLGMGRLGEVEDHTQNDGLKFIIMLTFGKTSETLRRDKTEFKRKSLTAISDVLDERLEPARLAPSSVNSQPWYFTHEDNIINTYRIKRGIFNKTAMHNMNTIDVGIALSHIYIANPETFKFFKAENATEIKGYEYIGSFSI